jgi:CRP/FNR family nitrogen fixation transcriptional regulator
MRANRATEPTSMLSDITVRSATQPSVPPTPGVPIFEMAGATMNFAGRSEIYGEDEPAEFLYKVVSGAVRTAKLLADGRRQIGAFYLPGDIFGTEMGEGGTHGFSAEAIVDSRVLVLKRRTAAGLAERNAALATALWNQAARDLARAGNRMILLGRKSAEERVVAFLHEMSGRQDGTQIVALPMSRQDIADYLGLTVETVSRTLTQLEADGTIRLVSARRIEIADPAYLEELDD